MLKNAKPFMQHKSMFKISKLKLYKISEYRHGNCPNRNKTKNLKLHLNICNLGAFDSKKHQVVLNKKVQLSKLFYYFVLLSQNW